MRMIASLRMSYSSTLRAHFQPFHGLPRILRLPIQKSECTFVSLQTQTH